MSEHHDRLCPKSASPKKGCACGIIESARLEGYEAAIREMSWECGDCGNTYGYDVLECPNKVLDEIAVAKQ